MNLFKQKFPVPRREVTLNFPSFSFWVLQLIIIFLNSYFDKKH